MYHTVVRENSTSMNFEEYEMYTIDYIERGYLYNNTKKNVRVVYWGYSKRKEKLWFKLPDIDYEINNFINLRKEMKYNEWDEQEKERFQEILGSADRDDEGNYDLYILKEDIVNTKLGWRYFRGVTLNF